MFTGIVQTQGRVAGYTGRRLAVRGGLKGFRPGDSVSVDGVCLTVVKRQRRGTGSVLTFDVSPETRRRTTLGKVRVGQWVNLEAAARAGDSLGGHYVLGHVDGVGRISGRRREGNSVLYSFQISPARRRYIVPKGAVTIDGISLTVVAPRPRSFSAAIVPHTLKQTTLGRKKVGDAVNLETDILAKYAAQAMGKKVR